MSHVIGLEILNAPVEIDRSAGEWVKYNQKFDAPLDIMRIKLHITTDARRVEENYELLVSEGFLPCNRAIAKYLNEHKELVPNFWMKYDRIHFVGTRWAAKAGSFHYPFLAPNPWDKSQFWLREWHEYGGIYRQSAIAVVRR